MLHGAGWCRLHGCFLARRGRGDLAIGTFTRVTFDGCPDRDVTYFGGVLAGRADACLHLRVRAAGAASRDLRLRLDRAPC